MSLFFIKSILAIIFLIAGLTAIICMLTLMGRSERKISAVLLRRVHKIAGLTFSILLLVISYFCIKYWIMVGDQISVRAAFHGLTGFTLFIVLVLKLLVVRFYKQFLRFVPIMGMIVFSLAFVATTTSAGYYLLRLACAESEPVETATPAQASLQGNIEEGSALFASKCISCHFADSEEKKHGPGLKDLLKKETLPHSGRPATIENVKKQLIRPILTMPSFANFSEKEMADILAYLETL